MSNQVIIDMNMNKEKGVQVSFCLIVTENDSTAMRAGKFYVRVATARVIIDQSFWYHIYQFLTNVPV